MTRLSADTSTLGSGTSLQLSTNSWRLRIRQAWLVGLRNMQIGRGHGRVSAMVFNTYRLTPAGREHLQSPILVELPASTTTEPLQPGSPLVSTSKAKLTRKSKGTNLLPALRRLLTSREHWFEITESSDYQYPGTFRFHILSDLVSHLTSLSFHFTAVQMSTFSLLTSRLVRASLENLVWCRS